MRSMVMVTGASRGLGQAIAASLHPYLLQNGVTGLLYVLVARSATGLQQTMETIHGKLSASLVPKTNVQILPFVVDLADLSSLELNVSRIFSTAVPQDEMFDTTLFINNAGSVGPLGTPGMISSLTVLQRAIDLNVTSSIWLSSMFVEKLEPRTKRHCRVVNISSLCAIQSFPTMGVYCSGKAAREMYHSVMAKDLAPNPRLKILNYAPGPCRTDMTQELSDSTDLDANLSQYFKNASSSGSLIDPWDSAQRLNQVLVQDTFDSGEHIDYYDS
jgi:sepiapterin reductase